MKRFLFSSFRNRLFAAFLAASLIPLFICSALLLQIFRLQMTSQAQQEASDSLAELAQILDQVHLDFTRIAAAVSQDDTLIQAVVQGTRENSEVYNRFLEVTQSFRDNACFDLYDRRGGWLYSTRNLPHDDPLSTQWGVLYAAEQQREVVFSPPEDSAPSGPCLLGAAPLLDGSGQIAGFLLIRLEQSDLNDLLGGAVGTSNNLLLLSAYWRPVYCSQSGLSVSLSNTLRQRLLSGQPLNSRSEAFTYTVSHHPSTGLYMVLGQPQMFTRDTMGLLYTVSASCALACLAISILMSLTLSRQMFHPIQRLHQAIEAVSHNNLDVYVPSEHNDELGQLAARFNEMLIALKHNQEQLVENQKELNEAQIRMLQAQLNPHFLCNTLDTMKWISKINKVPQVAVMSTNLADILRFCVSPDEFVPLRQELEILNRYVEIQRIRLSGTFTFRPLVPLELEACLVPKMMLQPIVENAILHGLDGVENGVAEIRAWARDGVLTIRVTDNGRGFPPELEGPYARRDRELSRGHLGLYNVDTILQKYYGQGFGLFLENCPDGAGAAVTATLPLRYEEEEPIPC